MKRLPVDKSEKFDIPDLYPGIVRTGTLAEGSCFFHSILKSLNKDNYSKMSEQKKLKYMIYLRNEIAESIILDYYKNNLNNTASFTLSEKLSNFLKVLYNFIQNPSDMINNDFLIEIVNKSLSVFKLVVSAIPKKEFVGIIDNKNITSSNTIDEYIKNFSDELYDLFLKKMKEEKIEISSEKLEICKSKITKTFNKLLNFIVKKQYENYKKKLKNTSEWASDLMFSILADYLKIDIYFINLNKKELLIYDHVSTGDRPSVVVGYINENHFESIGILENEKIKRLFDFNHPFIMKIKEVIEHKKK
jgi:hypothetical protein